MREIGGYIEFEHYNKEYWHRDAVALNCGRNALAYLLEAKGIKKIMMPYFMCDSCEKVLKKYKVNVGYYHITRDFLPDEVGLEKNQWIYIVNYYGQLSNSVIMKLKKRYKKIIVDNAQSYFQMPVEGVDTLYTCRKYFGVSDGAFLYTDVYLNRKLSMDESYKRMTFLLGRFEKSANEFYSEYVENNKLFENEPIKSMSKLTKNILRSIDYEEIIKRRTENYTYLNEAFSGINKLNLCIPSGAFMYPLYIENGQNVRKKMISSNIYIPTLWPNVMEHADEDSWEYQYTNNILPLPVDQRYKIEDMKYIAERIMGAF